jgi:hypothetical protein
VDDHKLPYFVKRLLVAAWLLCAPAWTFPLPISGADNRLEPREFTQLVNHFDRADARTFGQRYFIDSSLAISSGSPVFLVLCGESTCSAGWLSGNVRSLAEKFHAHLVALEHRYYGKSQPFPDLTVEHLRYLTVAQTLEDIHRFQTFAMKGLGLTGKWIVSGASYSANLAAYYRMLYPELTKGAWACSSAVHLIEDFSAGDAFTARQIGAECAQRVRETVAAIESTFGTDSEKGIHQLFNAEAIEDEDQFLYFLSYIPAYAAQVGLKRDFCAALSGSDPLGGYWPIPEI